MKYLCIIQARMSSRRLPGKVLMPLGNKKVLNYVYDRCSLSKKLSKVIIATSIDETDDAIESFCNENLIDCFRGSLNDVLSRYYHAAEKYNTNNIVRITADCPLIDPYVIDQVVIGFEEGNYDCFSLSGDFPDGLDCQVFSFSAIKKAFKEAVIKSDREHVGPYIERNKHLFSVGSIELFHGFENYRWTLDCSEDYQLITQLVDGIEKIGKDLTTDNILSFLEMNSHLMDLNKGIERNEGYRISLEEDKNNSVK